LVSGRRGSLRIRRIPCHLAEEPPVPGRVIPLTTSARPLGQAAAAFLVQPDVAASTRRSYQQTLGRLERALGADQPLATLTVDQVAAAVAAAWGRTGSRPDRNCCSPRLRPARAPRLRE
jgi:hypothetical protein